jgi:hypothetical protein
LTEFQKLRDRWEAKTGEQMPESITALPLETIRRAVELTEMGYTVGLHTPKESPPEEQPSSLTDWDRQDFKNGNAYGGQ